MANFNFNFTDTSHGKGALDGLRGTLKRVLLTAVLTRKVSQVLNAEELTKSKQEKHVHAEGEGAVENLFPLVCPSLQKS